MSRFALLCSGQGAQSPELFSSFPFGKNGLGLKQAVLEAGCLEPDVAAWLADPSANPPAIFQNHFSQPLLCLFQAMVWADLAPLLPAPDLIAGYSLGELSAYGCAGAIAPEEIIRLAGIRARLMDSAGPRGELLAVRGLSPAVVAAREDGYLAIAISDDHCVIGCPAECAPALEKNLHAAGASEVVPLAVTVASHTPLLDSAVGPFRQALQALDWKPPRIPVLAGVNAVKVMRSEQIERWLPEQIHRTVRWDLIQQRMAESNCRVLLELGPGSQLAHMALATGAQARGVGEFRSAEGVAAWVKNALRLAE